MTLAKVAAAVDAGLAAGKLSARSFATYDRRQRRRFKVFRRFARGFYDPAFRDLFFQPTNRFGMLDAIVNVLSGNWRPSLATRLRIAAFFALVRAQRRLTLAPRTHDG